MLHDASVSLDMFGQDFLKKEPGRKMEKTDGTLTNIQGTKLCFFWWSWPLGLLVVSTSSVAGVFVADLLVFWLDFLMFSSFSIISHWLFFDLLGVVIARYRKYP